MKNYLATVATLIALTGAPCFAQAAPAADPAVSAAVKDMLVSMHYRDVMTASFRQVGQTMPATMHSMVVNMVNSDPKLNADDKKQAMAKVEQILPGAVQAVNTMLADPALIDEMMDEMVPLYANTYSVAEIRQIAAFYQSPVGQKMLANMPKLMSDSMALSNKIIGPRVGKLMQQIMQDAAKL